MLDKIGEKLIEISSEIEEKEYKGKRYRGFTLCVYPTNSGKGRKWVAQMSLKGKKYLCYLGKSPRGYVEKIEHFILSNKVY